MSCCTNCRISSSFQFTCPSRSTTWSSVPPEEFLRVSIHVPLAEHDSYSGSMSRCLRGSIHVPLAEHDQFTGAGKQNYLGFNSRAPRGARLYFLPHQDNTDKFQFTCPSRSTTSLIAVTNTGTIVSIHVPLAEHDHYL